MIPFRNVLGFASLAVLVFACGGKSLENRTPQGSTCPAASSLVKEGDPCSWGGSCAVQEDVCNAGSGIAVICACGSNGIVECPPVAVDCPVQITCPPPAQVVDGASCAGVLSCPTVIDPGCGGAGGNCECVNGAWSCPVSPCPPPPPPPLPACHGGSPCAPGSSCTTEPGPCGETLTYTCGPSGTFGSESYACTEGATCTGQSPCGGQVFCTCSQDSIVCDSPVCSGEGGAGYEGGYADGGVPDGI